MTRRLFRLTFKTALKHQEKILFLFRAIFIILERNKCTCILLLHTSNKSVYLQHSNVTHL